MIKMNSQLAVAAALSAALLAGCGGGDSGFVAETATPPAPIVNPVISFSENATRVVSILMDTFARGENTEPFDITGLTLPDADTDEPVPI